jgi:maltose/moltooligosaccharide transporter
MSFGFFGIQFGWSLQQANMSAMYEKLGASADQIPILWLAAPLTGFIVQPIIGHMSDRTWNRLGRRRPYFLVGAVLATIALALMPHVTALWMAATLLWIMDASINISMEPFRAFVADMLPEEQRTAGFATQALFIGLGSVIAFGLPFLLSKIPALAERAVELSFTIGAIVYLAAVLWTIFTTREYPPEDMAAFQAMKAQTSSPLAAVEEILHDLLAMPKTMRRLAWVQLFTWLGLFCMWIYFGVAIAHDIFHGDPDTNKPLYNDGVAWGGVCFAVYSAVTFVFSFALPEIAKRIGRKATHSLCLALGAIGLASVVLIHDKYLLFASMTGVGIAWASILAMPYAMLAGSLPEGKTGIYMGIFNFFIVLPEIIAALGFGWVMKHVLGDHRMYALVVGGGAMAIAAVLVMFVPDDDPRDRKAGAT